MTDRPAVVLDRTLPASPETIWAMWTEPEHFAAWYGPTGATVTVLEMDVSVGGRRHIMMEMPGPDGPRQMWFVGEHLEIARPDRLVYTESISNAAGDVVDPTETGVPGDHPLVTEVRVELRADGDATHLVLTHVGVPADSPGATGWNMALDALAAICV